MTESSAIKIQRSEGTSTTCPTAPPPKPTPKHRGWIKRHNGSTFGHFINGEFRALLEGQQDLRHA